MTPFKIHGLSDFLLSRIDAMVTESSANASYWNLRIHAADASMMKDLLLLLRTAVERGWGRLELAFNLDFLLPKLEDAQDAIQLEALTRISSSAIDFSISAAGEVERKMAESGAFPSGAPWVDRAESEMAGIDPMASGAFAGISPWNLTSVKFAGIRKEILAHFGAGATPEWIVNAIAGRIEGEYSALRRARYALVAIARTAYDEALNQALLRLFRGTAGVASYEWVAYRDDATSSFARERDGQIYGLDSGVLPPGHIAGRSVIGPVFSEQPRIAAGVAA